MITKETGVTILHHTVAILRTPTISKLEVFTMLKLALIALASIIAPLTAADNIYCDYGFGSFDAGCAQGEFQYCVCLSNSS